MDRSVIKKILNREQLTQEEFNTFIVDYVKSEKNQDITAKQLQEITVAVQHGVFDIMFAAKKAAEKENLQVVDIFNKNGQFVTTYVYEK